MQSVRCAAKAGRRLRAPTAGKSNARKLRKRPSRRSLANVQRQQCTWTAFKASEQRSKRLSARAWRQVVAAAAALGAAKPKRCDSCSGRNAFHVQLPLSPCRSPWLGHGSLQFPMRQLVPGSHRGRSPPSDAKRRSCGQHFCFQGVSVGPGAN